MAEASPPSGGATSETAPYVPPRSRGKLLGIVVALLIVTNVATGLTVYYVTAPAPAGPAAVQVVGPWAGSEWQAFKPVLDLFKNDTGISYQYTTSRQEDLSTTLPIQFQAKQSQGDLIFMPSSAIQQYAARGWAMDLKGTIDPTTYQPGALTPVNGTNAIWGGAYTGKVKPGFWYRPSFFQAHSLQVPTTWDQFWTLLSQIKNISGVVNPILSGDGVGWPLSDVTEAFIETYGGATMHQQLTARTLSWTDPSVEAIFQNYLVKTLQAGFWSQPITWNDPGVSLWWNGSYPLYFMGSWITGMVPDTNDLAVFALPGGVANQGIVFAADYFFVPTYAAHPDLGKQLAKFLSTKDAQAEAVKQGGNIATAAGVPLSDYPAIDAKVAGLLQGKTVLPDLDDTIGNPFQTTFWSDLQQLWATPANWQNILTAIQTAAAAQS